VGVLLGVALLQGTATHVANKLVGHVLLSVNQIAAAVLPAEAQVALDN